MAFKSTELDAVNAILSNVGISPITSLDNPNPMVALARNILVEVSVNAQSDGWVFNTEFHYPLVRDTNDQILIPDNVLTYDIEGIKDELVVIRSGKLYDKYNHTFEFTRDLEATVVWYFEFTDLPEPFKRYITVRAANLFAGRAVGSQEAVKFSEKEELLARAALIEYECSQGNYNFFQDTATGRNLQSTYTPLDTIWRRW